MEAEDSDSASIEYDFETQPGSVGFMVLDSQSESHSKNPDEGDVMQIWPALQPREQKEEEAKTSRKCITSVMDTSGDEQKPAEAPQILATETELSESELEMEVTVIEKPGKTESQKPTMSSNGKTSALFRSLSPQDMFENEDEDRDICTPAGFVGSLHLSNQPMLVPETTESDPFPSTPEEFADLPRIIPSSPTDGSFKDDSVDNPAQYDPQQDPTLADDVTVLQKMKSDKPEDPVKKTRSSSEEKEEEEEQKTKSESVEYDPKRVSTLAGNSDDQSLHLHYSETQRSSNVQKHTADSVEVVGTEFMDVISIHSTDPTEMDQVPESQELSLRLTPSQSDKSGRETDIEVVPDQNRTRLPLVKSQDLVTEKQTLQQKRKACLSQPSKLDRDQDIDVSELRKLASETKSRVMDVTMASESENFALSLPKDGELLHPKILNGKSSKPGVEDKASERTSQEAGPSHYILDSPEQGPSHLCVDLEDTPPAIPVTMESHSAIPGTMESQSQVSSHSFTLKQPDVQNIKIRDSEETQKNVFRSVTGRDSPQKRLIQEDSDDEVVVIVHKRKKSQPLSQDDLDEVASHITKSQSKLTGTPETTSVEKTSQLTDKVTSGGTPLRKVPSISSEGSQSRVSLHKKTSVSTEGGYQASVEDEQSTTHIAEQEVVVQSHEPEPLIAIPVHIPEEEKVDQNREPETTQIKVTKAQKKRRQPANPIVQTPVSGKKRKSLTKLRTGGRIRKSSQKETTEAVTPTLLTTPTVTTTSSTSSEESSQINMTRPSLLSERSTIVLSPPLARASSLESVLAKPPLMSTSVTPTNRPSKIRTSQTEPRFKVPLRKSSDLDQQLTASQDVERKTIIVKVKQFEVRTEITEIIRQGKIVSKSEKEVSKEPVTIKVKTYQEMEALSPSTLSPSRTGSSLTSGDLGDISSSLSKSGSSNVPSSLSEHDVPSRQPSILSLDGSTEVSQVISPVQELAEPVDRVLAPLPVVTTTSQVPKAASIRSASFTPNVSTGFVFDPASVQAESVVSKPRTSTGASRDIPEERQKVGSSGEVSSEVPFQDEQNITATSETTGVGLIRTEPVKDSRIMAKWKDGYFYPGTILRVDGSRYQVKFDDGDSCWVRHSQILWVERLPLGQPVMVQSQDGYFDAGLIVGQEKKGGVVQYSVEKDSGEQRMFHKSQVILNEDQANLLLTDLPVSPQKSAPTVEPNPGNVSLDNLVEGKRRAGSKYAQSEWTKSRVGKSSDSTDTTSKSKPHRPSTRRAANKTENFEEPSTSKGVRKSEESDLEKPSTSRALRKKFPPIPQKATSTPTPKEKGKGKRKAVDPESTPTYPDIPVAVSPIEHRRSPRKVRQGLFDKEKQPSNPLPFSGLVFLLTYVEKSRDFKEEEKALLRNPNLTSDESSAENDDEAPFDKQDITRRIVAGGGRVLDKFDEAEIASAKQCFLISNSYQRTIKYFQCLAAAIPCVSHLWIRDSSSEGMLLDYKAYKLQAGVSIEKRKLMEWSNRKGDLKGLSVFVSSSHKKFLEEWSFTLRLAGCQVLDKLPSVNSGTPVNVIVTDLTCPKSVLRYSKKYAIPLVASEWVIQCLINGRRLSYTGHPRYSYDFKV
ncbi:TP53-binding protein 1-like [Saccostrea echinata]|uniref:TP53-binding protein 1-like n=1 Tax=Saccostrea echinata TaxID=191078 RepID=UPI002A82F90C|nr:TP53-binding protein 1-like [Saccostrea echinata]